MDDVEPAFKVITLYIKETLVHLSTIDWGLVIYKMVEILSISFKLVVTSDNQVSPSFVFSEIFIFI